MDENKILKSFLKSFIVKAIKERFLELKKKYNISKSTEFYEWEKECIALGDNIKLTKDIEKLFGSGRNLCYYLFWYGGINEM